VIQPLEKGADVTLRKPEGVSVVDWALRDMSLKTIVVVGALLVGNYVAIVSRVTVVEQSAPNVKADMDRTQREIEELKAESVSKADMESEERSIDARLAAQQESLNRIEGYLMERKSVQ